MVSKLFPERLWATLFILVPLVYNPLSRWQYEPDKAALALLLTGWLLAWSLWQVGLPKVPRYPVEWWMGGYLFIRLLATAHSIAPHWSLWGDPAWRNGLWLTMASVVLFGLARRQFMTAQRRAAAVTMILIGGTVVAAYGVFQYTGLDPLSKSDWVRVPSTLAHPNLLAAYLVMLLPLTLARLLAGRQRVWMGSLLVLQSLCLVFTYSRAGWLAAMVGVLALGIAWLWVLGRRRLAMLLGVGAVLGWTILFAMSLLPPLPGSAPHALQTLSSMFRWKGATVQIRLLGWQASLKAIGAHPWLGYGPATFRVVMEWFMMPALAPFGGDAALGGRPHNIFLEVAIESGLLGLAAYLGMLAALLIPLVALLQGGDREIALFRAGVLGALVANLVTLLFSFESIATMVLFWALAGMAHASPVPVSTSKRPKLGKLVAAGCTLLAIYMAVPDMLAFVGESMAAEGLWRESVTLLGLASDIAPTPEVFLASQGNVYAMWAAESRDGLVWQCGADTYAQLVGRRSDVAEYWRKRGLYLRLWNATLEDVDVAQQAVDAYTEALRLSPHDPDLWLDRGLMWLDAGKFDKALADLRYAGALLDDYSRYYGAMSIYALTVDDLDAAAMWQRRALDAQRAWDAWSWRR